MTDEIPLENTMRLWAISNALQLDSMLSDKLAMAAEAVLKPGMYEIYIEVKPVKEEKEDD